MVEALERLRTLEPNYRPNPRVAKGMGELSVMGLVGVTAAGKTTLMNWLIENQPDHFGIVLNETSRQPRETDLVGTDYIYCTVEEFADDAETGELVQFVTTPLGDVYGTRLSSYPADKTGLIPLVPRAVKVFRQLPFGSFEAAYVVPADFDRWYGTQLAAHETASNWTPEQRADRLDEAVQNMEQGLADDQIRFVLNEEVERAGQRLLQMARGESPADEDRARQIVADSLKRLRAELEE